MRTLCSECIKLKAPPWHIATALIKNSQSAPYICKTACAINRVKKAELESLASTALFRHSCYIALGAKTQRKTQFSDGTEVVAHTHTRSSRRKSLSQFRGQITGENIQLCNVSVFVW